MFWRFGFNNPSAIDGLLEQPDTTLEQVLTDQDIIQEAKSQNPKLIEFLTKKDNLSELIDLFYTLDSEKQRLPLIACEILACEIPRLVDAIVLDHQDLLLKFWDFLRKPFSVDASYSFQAAYFSKIITIFLTKRTTDMLGFIKSTPENLKLILAHLQSSAIMDLLLTLMRLEELPEAKGIVQWLSDNGLLINLLYRLDPNQDTDEHSTAQQCICEIVRMSQTSLIESPSLGVNDIITTLTSRDTMQTMVDFMLDTSAPNSVSSLINCVTIIIDIIRHNNSDLDQETSFAVVLGYQNQIAQQSGVSLINMLSVLTENIDKFVDLLLKPNQVNTPRATTPLGFERLKICELFAELLHCSNMSSLNVIQGDADAQENSLTYGDSLKLALVKHKVMPVSIDLFFEFPLNNFLHYVVYDSLHQIFNGQMNRESNRQLALSIFNEARLTDKIVKAQEQNDIECAKPKGTRLGYMGHLTFISDEIIKLFEGYPESIISALDDSIDLDKWQQYCMKQLLETKERDSLPLGDIRANNMLAIADHDDNDIIGDLDEEELDAEEAISHRFGQFDDDGEEEEEEDGDDQWMIDNIDESGNQHTITVMEYHAEDDSSSSTEEKEDDYSSSDDEDTQVHIARRKTQWSGGEYDPFSTAGQNDNESKADNATAADDDAEDKENPFGDFASSSSSATGSNPDQTEPQWQDSFASNFADMDLSTVKLSQDKPPAKESTVNA
ncbi:Ser/Thr protein phosphatase 6 regulatory subunit 3 isoform X9 [Mucor ambiguus]|uniref:Ser/Thr protein phosphatase 6 regulatory subunit 3 isoform X9 n=1 Tax=Mucor ambiguus TaxID=91626 RepID=A0A0C9MQJ5_9FUNG|nr:Ser/Thr protein phosphatase 6 regulatory subunit 3 isoform X9 [Mucor ambiguus]